MKDKLIAKIMNAAELDQLFFDWLKGDLGPIVEDMLKEKTDEELLELFEDILTGQ